MKRLILLAAAAVMLGGPPAQAQEKLKIGVIATLSGPPAVLGQQLRNGFNLAVKTLGGKLGGREAEVIVVDDELKPDVAVTKVKALVDREIADEVYVPLNQLDFSAELSKIAAAKPEAIYVFLPGGMGVNFVKQFRQAGLADSVTFLSAFTVDESTLPAQQDAAFGFFGGSNWAPDLDTPQNKAFVAAYEKEFNAVPATYAFQAYDAALLIDSAVRAVGGNVGNKDALRAAMMKADFKSLRGGFKFNTNHYPIQDFYLVKVAKRADGKYETQIVKKVFENYADTHAKDCPMK